MEDGIINENEEIEQDQEEQIALPSAARYLYREFVQLEQMSEIFPIPQVGQFLLVNEETGVNRKIFRELGHPKRQFRGVVEVMAIGGPGHQLIRLKVYDNPDVGRHHSIHIKMFGMGFYRYRELTRPIYTGRYDYEDLDLAHPHEDISRLFKKPQLEEVQECNLVPFPNLLQRSSEM